jgi:hypothetical protein
VLIDSNGSVSPEFSNDIQKYIIDAEGMIPSAEFVNYF